MDSTLRLKFPLLYSGYSQYLLFLYDFNPIKIFHSLASYLTNVID